MIHDTEVEVHHEINLTTTTIHKTDIALQLEIDLDMTKVLLIHTTLDHDMTTTKDTRDLIALLIYPHADDLINVTLVTDTDHAHIQEITTDLHLFFRPSFRPRDSWFSRSRSHSNTKKATQYNSTQIGPINFEVQMYHPFEMGNAVTPTSWFYSLYTHTPSNQNQRDSLYRLEIFFLLDSDASISVLNKPTYITSADFLNNKQNTTLNASKTLTVANQTEVPFLHYVSVILNRLIADESCQFTILFAVADMKYNILGTQFFENTEHKHPRFYITVQTPIKSLSKLYKM